MNAARPSPQGTAFLPHDLATPLAGAAGGRLAGLTVAVKDAYDIAGERTGIGSPEWLAKGIPASATAAAVRSVLEAGATVVGKTICDEFLFSVTGANAHYGTPLNPRAPDRLPGGSSSGSASATAAGACDFALGTDTGGSIRIPAALCGVYGFRPTHRRVDMTGVQPMAPSFDSAGWFASDAGMLRRVGRVLLDDRPVAATVERVLVATDLVDVADSQVQDALAEFLATIGEELPTPNSVRLAPDGIDDWVECFRVIQGFETWQTFGDWITANAPHLGPGIDERMRYASTVRADDVESARRHRTAVRDRLHRLLTPGSIVLLPTAPCPAPRLSSSADELHRFRSRASMLTCPGGLGGLPQVSLPIGSVDTAPIALSVLGWGGGDEALLDLACRLGRYPHDAADTRDPFA